MDKTTLYLPRDLHHRLRQAARRSGRPQADMIRSALDAYLRESRADRPRSIGAGEDETTSRRRPIARRSVDRRGRGRDTRGPRHQGLAPRTLAQAVITLDTSTRFALLNRRDPAHAVAVETLDSDPGPYLAPSATLGEIAFLVEERLGLGVLDLLLADLESGARTLDCGEADLGRARHLVQRYADLSLGFVDAAVITCAERNGGRVLTFDIRDFSVVAAEGTITVLPGTGQP